ncbi:protein-tyrosine-phosphatase [Formosimonas limnophila]|uniref:Protein-tyrosine-phosphatase n=1 Tax=Formosimonas limnophila TaxID=1384487 RepID=A0A8J3CNG0_9BURK|nr:tyrosine-protein phosphatase [Formosimonas limnophila]GHA74664.1 protein-tyrosine-phosphatase [Formosimonas limnophila]
MDADSVRQTIKPGYLTKNAARTTRAAFFLTTTLLSGCATYPALPSVERPSHWAQPVTNPPLGLFNVHQVSPTLFRSAQPPLSGVVTLKLNEPLVLNGQTIKTLINLRAAHDEADALLTTQSQLNYHHIRFNTWHAEDEDVIRFLKAVTDPAQQPILLHCKHGADRTGMMVAIYRIVVQDWDKKTAIAEMKQDGFDYHIIWANLERYIMNLDVAKLKEQVKN